MSQPKQYTAEQKAEYYKKLYQQSKGTPQRNYYKRKYRKRYPKQNSNYKNNNYRNKNYSLGASLGEAAGNAIGGPLGGKIGAFLGKGAQQMFKSLTGFGDYKIQANTLMKGGMTPPMIVNSINRGGYIVRHREYLQDISSTTSFTVNNYFINPGLSSSFPWLSQVASSFEEYSFRGLVYEFKSTSSDAVLSSATSPALGTISMATAYNSLNANFASKVEMENYEFANSDKPSVCFYHPIECKLNQTPVSILYVRDNAVPNGADQRLYDLGNFQIATSGMQASGGVLGELWVTYEIELYKPKFYNGGQIYTDHYNLATIANTHPLGTTSGANTVTQRAASTSLNWQNNGTLNAAGTVYNFVPQLSSGKFLVVMYWAQASDGTVGVPTITGTNCTLKQYWGNDTGTQINNPENGASSKTLCIVFIVLLTGQNATITVGTGGTLPGTNGDLWVTQINEVIDS
jgi:hypothetical protein